MPAANRALGRDVHIYAASDPTGPVLGGLILTNGVTNANFYSMVDIILILSSIYHLQDADGSQLGRDNDLLLPGNYYVVTDGSISTNDEDCLTRTISLGTGPRTADFRKAVRERDGRCVITGKRAVNAHRGMWSGFQAAHIFPLAYLYDWNANNFGSLISIESTDGEPINSVQNGMLLRADIHILFDSYELSIDPDDNHKIVCFFTDEDGIAGKHLDQQFLDDPRRPVDDLLRWHYRQAVLANVRSVGEPIFEVDFPPGSDMIGEILSGPKAGERMQYELFTRLIVDEDKAFVSNN
ncbi:HNH endonuclease-domain-containing protein [Morchella snyderi]|nr:HNH endonuclease-domain-containing protein [Morchella snyderi]